MLDKYEKHLTEGKVDIFPGIETNDELIDYCILGFIEAELEL